MAHDYYIVGFDFGKRTESVLTRDRRSLVDSLRLDGWSKGLAFIHHIKMDSDTNNWGVVHDVTKEILKESGFPDGI